MHSDRLRTANNVMGDVYAAAVVEHYSKSDLAEMDEAVADKIRAEYGELQKKLSLPDAVLVGESS